MSERIDFRVPVLKKGLKEKLKKQAKKEQMTLSQFIVKNLEILVK